MNDLEKHLKAVRLAAPSPALDRRMDDMFAQKPDSRSFWRKWALWSSLTFLTVAGATAVLMVVSAHSLATPIKPIVYRIEADGPMRQFLLDPPASAGRPPHFVVRSAFP